MAALDVWVNTCPKVEPILNPKITNSPANSIGSNSRSGGQSRWPSVRAIMPSKSAALGKAMARMVMGGNSMSMNLTAGQFMPHSTPIRTTIATEVALVRDVNVGCR